MPSNITFRQLELARMQSGQENASVASDDMARIIERQRERIAAGYEHALREVEENRGARETKSTWMLLGTLIGGLGIGSGIGQGIGEGASDGDRAEARAARSGVEGVDHDLKALKDRFADARQSLSDQNAHVASVEKISREIQEAGWIGVVP